MSLTVYAYVLLFTALVAAAAVAMEWGARGRIPLRHIWSAAIWAALLAPPAALAWHGASRSAVAARSGAMPNRVTTVLAHAGRTTMRRATTLVSHDAPIRVLIKHKPRLRVLGTRISARLILTLVPLWICASAAFIVWLLIGALHWRRARRSWRSTVIDGVRIEVSPATGPAVLGVISHRIVLPEWAMSMPPDQRRLMLTHECEHVSARDPERLALAVAALILMPWNAALWWCAARLRRAIELDCDARVLRRHPGAKEYGHLLLDVASRGQGFGPMGIPSVALLRLPSELELRLRAMMQQRRAARHAIVVGAGIAVIAVAAAFTTPVPDFSVLRGSLPKPGSGAARQSAVILHRIKIRVGQSMISLDSGIYSPRTHTISAGRTAISSMYLANADTDSTDKGSQNAAALRRKADSLRSISQQLAAKERELLAVRARLDSTQRTLLVTNAQLRSISLSAGSSGRENAAFSLENAAFAKDNAAFARSMEIERKLREKYLPSAIDRNYPGISKSVKPGMLLWFVVDSSGRVIRTARDDTYDHSVYFSAELAAKRFPGIASHDITSISVTPKVIDNVTATIVWAVDGKP